MPTPYFFREQSATYCQMHYVTRQVVEKSHSPFMQLKIKVLKSSVVIQESALLLSTYQKYLIVFIGLIHHAPLIPKEQD